MNAHKNYVQVEIGEVENTCFVVMPFDSLFQTQYERVIRPAVEECGLKCVRGDEIYSKPQIMGDIWKSIRQCRLLIAELTGKNANVFYEIGLAHAIGKPIILLTRNEEDVPFDLKALRYRYYNVNDPFWGENLRDAIKSMIQNVLEQTDSLSYLEGIAAQVIVPTPPLRKTQPSRKAIAPIDISGNWRATFRTGEDPEHEGMIYITQHKEKLSATMTITIDYAHKVSIIQEILIGTIKEKTVTLGGVSYTFIKQGVFWLYKLDNFNLKLSTDRKVMSGEVYSENGRGKANLTRTEGNESL